MARLTIKFGTKVESVLELDVKELVIGRGSDAQLELEHDLVSRNHARVRLVGDGFVVEDLGSKTGTFVNGGKATAHILGEGDSIGIGPYTLVYSGLVEKESLKEGPVSPDTQDAGAFWAQAAAESGIQTGSHAGAAGNSDQETREGPSVPASALGPRGDGAKDMDDYQGTMLASADEMQRIRESLEVSQKPHLTVRLKKRTKKLPIEDTTFEVGFHEGADYQITGSKLFGKRQFIIREIGEGNFEVASLSWWANVSLNGTRIRGRGKLKNGSLIEAAGLKFRFKAGD
ncbi:MAG: FHA domain-containing protein [Deltaproteobacteria bacterium]|nr:FHA domain-containing protein [Deltaproteobacteria bacterium]